MKNKKWIAIMWALAVIPAILTLLFWDRLPEQIPNRWSFNGVVSYGGKGNLWLMAALGPGMAALFQFLPRLDPKKENYKNFMGYYNAFAIVMEAFILVMVGIILVETFRPGTLRVGKVVMVLLSLLFLGMGSVMGKVKPNWFMGIRTPWALSDPDVWNKTHRLGGWVFFLVGLINIPVALLCPEKVCAAIFFTALMAGGVLTYVMSYRWYKLKNRE